MPQDTKIYVGNLSWNVLDNDLKEAFNPYGDILSATVCLDRETNRSRGFGFVEFASRESIWKAIEAEHGRDLMGRAMVIREALPKERRPPRQENHERSHDRRRFDRGDRDRRRQPEYS